MADDKPAYLPHTDYPKLRLMAEAACYEADNEIVAALDEIGRLRAENAALREAGGDVAFALLSKPCCDGWPDHTEDCTVPAWVALNAPYLPEAAS